MYSIALGVTQLDCTGDEFLIWPLDQDLDEDSGPCEYVNTSMIMKLLRQGASLHVNPSNGRLPWKRKDLSYAIL